ncbi:MAG: polymer-forming cytoskeletal protein [Gracilibacteraceae bacterium]|nr:polymer-forming cytoskeletal protein [Gracilibacteraceae bacterium]
MNASLFILPADAYVKGRIVSVGDARLEGKFEGEIEIKGDLTLGISAQVEGGIKARNISIGGRVKGWVAAANLLEITSTGQVGGDIVTKDLLIEAGGIFTGACRHW